MALQVLTAWGLLSGALFVSSAANTFIAIKHLGLSVASGIWCGTAILVSFFYGVGVAGDQVSHGLLAGVALVLLLVGVIGIATAGQLGRPSATVNANGVESGQHLEALLDAEDPALQRSKHDSPAQFPVGCAAAIGAGIFGAPLVTFCLSAVTQTPNPLSSPDTAAWYGMASGALWQAGNACSIVAVQDPRVGLAVAADVKKAYAQPGSGTYAVALASQLAAKGYTVKLRQGQGGGALPAAFCRLPHTFVVVSMPADPEPFHCGVCPGFCSSELIVEPSLRSHFTVPRCSERYAALVDLLPAFFVGPACQLEHIIDWLSRELHWSYKQRGEELPPWRQKGCLLSKWLPAVAKDTPVDGSHRRGLNPLPSAAGGRSKAAQHPASRSLQQASSSGSRSGSFEGRGIHPSPLPLPQPPAPEVAPHPAPGCPGFTTCLPSLKGRSMGTGLAAEDPADIVGFGSGSPFSPSCDSGRSSPLSVLPPTQPFTCSTKACLLRHEQLLRAPISLLTRQLGGEGRQA
ncbi:hypothetical protein N2152v2_008917 [Parachlorella kessleri]